jgi:hypothetical protein
MHLEFYTCDLCILQREETLRHLFFRCSFAKNCWQQIGVVVPTWLKLERATRHIKRAIRLLFAMERIILNCWVSGRTEMLGSLIMNLLGWTDV